MAKSKFVSIQPFPYFPQKLNFETTMSTYRHVVDGVWIARVYCCPCSAWKWASNGVRILWVPRTRPCCHTMETAGQTDSGVNSWVVHFFITFSLFIFLCCCSSSDDNNMCETNTLRARSTLALAHSQQTRTSTRNKSVQKQTHTKICQEKEKVVAVKRKERARAAVPRQVCNSQ